MNVTDANALLSRIGLNDLVPTAESREFATQAGRAEEKAATFSGEAFERIRNTTASREQRGLYVEALLTATYGEDWAQRALRGKGLRETVAKLAHAEVVDPGPGQYSVRVERRNFGELMAGLALNAANVLFGAGFALIKFDEANQRRAAHHAQTHGGEYELETVVQKETVVPNEAVERGITFTNEAVRNRDLLEYDASTVRLHIKTSDDLFRGRMDAIWREGNE